MSTRVRSLSPSTGTNAIKRLAAADISVVAPGASIAGLDAQGADFIHLYVRLNNPATTCTIRMWVYSTLAGQWFSADVFTFTNAPNVKSAISEIRGEEKVWFQLEAIDAGTVDIWAGYSHVFRHAD